MKQPSRPAEPSPLRATRAFFVTFALVAVVLAATLVIPPPRPTMAANEKPPRDASSPTGAPAAKASPSARPAAEPSPSVRPAARVSPTARPAAEPSPSVRPAASPSPGAAPSASPSPGASPSPAPMDEKQKKRLQAILKKAEDLNPTMKDSQADVNIALKARIGFLVLPIDLQGTCYYKRPDHYKMELKNAPQLLSKYPQMFGYRPVRSGENHVTLLPDAELNGRPQHVLRFDVKGDSDFRGSTLWLDRDALTSTRSIYSYKHDGKIQVDFKWRKDGDYWVLDTVNAALDFPQHGVSATADASYGQYKFNSGLDDQLFAEKKK